MVKKTSVLIVGAGEFGAGTALSLLKTGNYTVTLIDRAPELPALDAASTDINKVVRWDYSDKDYAKLAREAIDVWNRDYKGIYFQSGVVVRGLHNQNFDGSNARTTYENVKSEAGVEALNTPQVIKSRLTPRGTVPTADVPDRERSYWNPVGGWAHAAKAVEKLYEGIIPLGGQIVSGAELSELILDGNNVKGVRTTDGRQFLADKVVVCTGSWTAAHPALSELIPQGLITATGQTICAVQLDDDEVERYKDIPVTFNFDGSGFYSFPPNQTGLVKFAIHGAGYTSPTGVPRTALDPKALSYTEVNQVGWIPRESLHALKQQMSLVYPELAKKPVAFTRMCWYSDVVDGDWVIDYTKKYPNLLIAAGGSGHAFKFLPIMGDLIRKRLENTLEPHLQHKWRLDRVAQAEDPQRTGMARKELDLTQLATKRELILGDKGVFAKL